MLEQRTPSPAEQEAQIDPAILNLLLTSGEQRLWSFDEIAREIGSDPTDGLNRLYGGGLIHRLDGFVWATRAAIVADEIKL